MSDTPQSGAELLARIKPQRRRVRTQICLRPDLLDAHAEAVEKLQASVNSDGAGQRLASGVSQTTTDLAKRVQELEAEIDAASPWFTLEAMPKDEYAVLCEQYPPRPDNQVDQYFGYNRQAVEDIAVRECMVDPVFDDDAWAQFVKVLNPSEWKELRDAVAEANGVVKSGPKSSLAATVLTRLAATSKSPASGE